MWPRAHPLAQPQAIEQRFQRLQAGRGQVFNDETWLRYALRKRRYNLRGGGKHRKQACQSTASGYRQGAQRASLRV